MSSYAGFPGIKAIKCHSPEHIFACRYPTRRSRMLRQWPLKEPTDKQDVVVSGKDLRIDDVVRVARRGARVRLTEERAVWDRVERSVQYIRKCAERGEPIYGVTTGFGGMANVVI